MQSQVSLGIDECGIRELSFSHSNQSNTHNLRFGSQRNSAVLQRREEEDGSFVNTRNSNVNELLEDETSGDTLHSIPGIIQVNESLQTEFATYESRLKTFEHWPRSLAQQPTELALAGFYYKGSSDKVHCYCCNVGLWSWESTDDPWVEHAKNAPKCTHLRLRKGDAFINECNEQETHIPLTKSESTLSSDSGVSFSSDVSSASDVSSSSDVSSESDEAENIDNEEDENLDEAIKDMKLENHQLKQEKCCKICLGEEVEVVFVPCGHLVSCVQCAPSLKDCPVCRTKIKAVVRAFLA